MSDHNFEKQIQQKLDELKVPPAPSVWTSIEAQIRKDKRRRRGIIFFPLFFLLLGAGAFFLLTQTESKPKITDTTNILTENSTPAEKTSEKTTGNKNTSDPENKSVLLENVPDKNDSRSSNSGSATVDPSTGTSAQKGVQQKRIREGEQQPSPNSISAYQNDVSPNRKVVSRRSRPLDKSAETAEHGNSATQVQQQAGKKEIKNEEATTPNSLEKYIEKVAKETEADVVKHDTIANVQAISEAHVSSDSLSKDSSSAPVLANNSVDSSVSAKPLAAIKAKQQNNRKSAFQWGLMASAGISNMSDGGFLDGFMGSEKALVADLAPNYQNSPGPSTPNAIIYRPSAIEKGFAFSAGLFIQKRLSKKFSIQSGLQYRYYSTEIEVGNRIDSSASLQNAFGSLNVSRYYLATQANIPQPVQKQQYTNRFHFVELPVVMNFKLNRSSSLPFFVSSGFSLSALVATNALHFDSQTGVYYKDNDLFRNVHANFSAGLSMGLLNKSKLPIHIGPELQYGLRNIFRPQLSSNKHFYYFGINTRVFLKK